MKKVECRMQNENAPRRVWHRFYNLPSSFFILLVRVYQLTLSPAKTVLLGPAGHCRFEPSCSQYAVEALKTHGALSGSWLAAKRICRCHPWGAHGEDPVPTVQSLKSKVQGLKSKEPAARSPRPKVPSPKSKNSAADLQVSNVGFL